MKYLNEIIEARDEALKYYDAEFSKLLIDLPENRWDANYELLKQKHTKLLEIHSNSYRIVARVYMKVYNLGETLEEHDQIQHISHTFNLANRQRLEDGINAIWGPRRRREK